MASTATPLSSRYPSWEYRFTAEQKPVMWNGSLAKYPHKPSATEQAEYRIRLRAGFDKQIIVQGPDENWMTWTEAEAKERDLELDALEDSE